MLDCLGQRPQCSDCFRVGHRLLPIHRVGHWTGTHSEATWLCQIGVNIHLVHQAQLCTLPPEDSNNDDASSDKEWDEDKDFALDHSHGLPKLKARIIVDRSELHRLQAILSGCIELKTSGKPLPNRMRSAGTATGWLGRRYMRPHCYIAASSNSSI